MPGEDQEFDNYLNEVSGEDVTSGGDGIHPPGGPEPIGTTTNTQPNREAPPPSFKEERVPGQIPQVSKGGKEQKAAAPATGLRPHVLGGFVNEEGDIVDDKGAIIAQKGTVRRVYEENGRLKSRMQQYENELNQLRTHSSEANVLNGAPTRLGLDNNDVATALDFAARVKRGDVVGVAKEMVARAVAEGRNVSEIIGDTVGDSVDMVALKQMLENHLGPIGKVRQDTAREAEINAKATTAFNKFVADNPHSDIHQFEIASIAKESNITVQKAYNALMDFIRRNNLDPSQPLEPQVRERQAQPPNQQPTGQRPANPSLHRPMPNGAVVNGGNGAVPPETIYADPNDDWGSIIKAAQAGFRTN